MRFLKRRKWKWTLQIRVVGLVSIKNVAIFDDYTYLGKNCHSKALRFGPVVVSFLSDFDRNGKIEQQENWDGDA